MRRGPLPSWLVPAGFCFVAALGWLLLIRQFGLDGGGRPQANLASAPLGPTTVRPPLRSETIELTSGVDDVLAPTLRVPSGQVELITDGSVWVDPRSAGRPWSDLGAVPGLLTFRGNPTRTFHGAGPVPTNPRIRWTVELGCSNSAVGSENRLWCGTGWTGQPAVFAGPDGAWWLAVGAYNRAVNFLDPTTGGQTYPPYTTGDIIKGSVTVDPDGYPLVYSGSRDNKFHVLAIDGDGPRELWSLSADAVQPTLWNDDWDGSALVVQGRLIVGGENGRFYVYELNRGYGADGKVTVDPELAFTTETWDQPLLDALGDLDVSVEGSVAMSGDVVYFANSGGLVQGWDLGALDDGDTPGRVFRFWTGDDTDATVVVDGDGMLYVASEFERSTVRSVAVGQIMKLDPSRPTDPVVWSRAARALPESGVWATPALHRGVVIVATNEGEVLGLEADTGDLLWQLSLPGPLWSSPVVVNDTLIQADCGGGLSGFDLTDPTVEPEPLWNVQLDGCIESTPAVWGGWIFVGSRSGRFYAVADAPSARATGD
ncbi:MAG: PQQ-binding-like beta-propeller repeat protein [Acidimicrobiales bacterium]